MSRSRADTGDRQIWWSQRKPATDAVQVLYYYMYVVSKQEPAGSYTSRRDLIRAGGVFIRARGVLYEPAGSYKSRRGLIRARGVLSGYMYMVRSSGLGARA